MSNEELIEQLFVQEDHLPRQIVDEICRRSSEVLPLLKEIVMDRNAWIMDLPEWWGPVHAVYILGAIGTKDVVNSILTAIRWADAYDNEWVLEDLPSILGSLGDLVYDDLIRILHDITAGWSARTIAMEALVSYILRHPEMEESVVFHFGKVLQDKSEEIGARRSAAFVLLDLRRNDYRSDIIGFAKSEENRSKNYPDYPQAFTVQDAIEELSMPRRGLDDYLRDWLTFYEQYAIEQRQAHWQNEDYKTRPDYIPEDVIDERSKLVIGRNTPCPCGSGRAYKRCCWNKLH